MFLAESASVNPTHEQSKDFRFDVAQLDSLGGGLGPGAVEGFAKVGGMIGQEVSVDKKRFLVLVTHNDGDQVDMGITAKKVNICAVTGW